MADTMEVEQRVRLLLTRNNQKLYEQNFSSTAESYTVHAADRVVLATNMSAFQQASLGDIGSSTPGTHMLVVSDRPIYIAVNTTAQQVYGDALAMSGANVTGLYFKNTDTGNEATVEFVVTD